MKGLGYAIPLACLTIFASGCGQSGGNSEAPFVGASADADKLCAAMQTGNISECSVSYFGRSVDVRIDTTGEEAQKFCSAIRAMVAKTPAKFAGEWKLRIFSPFSGDHPLAVCVLY